ncbi:hypothetical protein FKM82_027912 [Ascaphus truei]
MRFPSTAVHRFYLRREVCVLLLFVIGGTPDSCLTCSLDNCGRNTLSAQRSHLAICRLSVCGFIFYYLTVFTAPLTVSLHMQYHLCSIES